VTQAAQGELITAGECGTFPLRVVAKLRHGVLEDLVARYGSQEALAKELGVCKNTLSKWISLKTIPTFEGGKSKGGMGRERAKRVVLRLCELTGKRIEDIFPTFAKEVFKNVPKTISIDRPLSKSQAEEALSRREAQSRLAGPSPFAVAASGELREAVRKALKSLSHREREIVKLRYGLGDGHSYTLKEVGQMFKVSAERIRGIEAKAIRKLQQRSAALVGHAEAVS
jgi:RNA polymerase sigma factor (sigma-70 family)